MKVLSYDDWVALKDRERPPEEGVKVDCEDCDGTGTVEVECECPNCHGHDEDCESCDGTGQADADSEIDTSMHAYFEAVFFDLTLLAEWQARPVVDVLNESGFAPYKAINTRQLLLAPIRASA